MCEIIQLKDKCLQKDYKQFFVIVFPKFFFLCARVIKKGKKANFGGLVFFLIIINKSLTQFEKGFSQIVSITTSNYKR